MVVWDLGCEVGIVNKTFNDFLCSNFKLKARTFRSLTHLLHQIYCYFHE